MANEDRRVSGRVHVDSEDAEAHVALTLMRWIADAEAAPEKASNPREYYLKLYYQCRAATGGRSSLSHVLTPK